MKLILASTNKNIVSEAASYTFEHRKTLTTTAAIKPKKQLPKMTNSIPHSFQLIHFLLPQLYQQQIILDTVNEMFLHIQMGHLGLLLSKKYFIKKKYRNFIVMLRATLGIWRLSASGLRILAVIRMIFATIGRVRYGNFHSTETLL